MSTYTDNLNLFKIIPAEDANKTFDFYSILNDNWDKLDTNADEVNANIANLNQLITQLFNQIMDRVYKIGQPIIRLDNTLYDNEVRLEGQRVLKTSYTKLYEVYGDAYGESDSSHFYLPNFTNRTFWGGNTFGYIEAGLPNILGHFHGAGQFDFNEQGNAFYKIGAGTKVTNNSNAEKDNDYGFDASRSSLLYGQSETVQPASVKIRVVTRYK